MLNSTAQEKGCLPLPMLPGIVPFSPCLFVIFLSHFSGENWLPRLLAAIKIQHHVLPREENSQLELYPATTEEGCWAATAVATPPLLRASVMAVVEAGRKLGLAFLPLCCLCGTEWGNWPLHIQSPSLFSLALSGLLIVLGRFSRCTKG